jgi:hypothetical protein
VNLLCRLGRHRPRGIPRWNDGFYFTTCGRCGCDLVRTAFQSWHVPSGYRVVWSDRPPAGRPDVALIPKDEEASAEAPAERAQPSDPGPGPAIFVPEPLPDPVAAPAAQVASSEPPAEAPPAPAESAAAERPAEAVVPPAAPAGRRLPIEDVLAQLNAEDSASRGVEETPAPEELPPRPRRTTWDFMDEDPGADSALGLASGRIAAPSAELLPPGSAGPRDEYGEARSRRAGGLPERWRALRSAVRNFWSGPAEPNPVLVIALALGVAVAVAVGLALSAGPSSPRPVESSRPGGAGPGQAVETDPFAADATDISGPEAQGPSPGEGVDDRAALPGEPAYVAASVLSCREAPVPQARRVRNLIRGKEVRVLGRDGGWASLAYRGGQCWARADFLSPVPPLEER